MTGSAPRPLLAALSFVAVAGLAACGGSGGDDHTPDEATFCRLALVNEPVAEAAASVLRRLDELAPVEIDPAVVVLREAAEELEDHEPGSPEEIAAEFEVRFRRDYIDARNQVEAFIDSECRDDEPTGTTVQETDAPGDDDDPAGKGDPAEEGDPADEGQATPGEPDQNEQ